MEVRKMMVTQNNKKLINETIEYICALIIGSKDYERVSKLTDSLSNLIESIKDQAVELTPIIGFTIPVQEEEE